MGLPARVAKIAKVTFKPLDILVLSLRRKFSGQAGGRQRPGALGRCQTFPTAPVRAYDPPKDRDHFLQNVRAGADGHLVKSAPTK